MGGGARRALVTGASAGIGRACAEELHAAGWAVTGASRRGTTSGGWAGLVMDVDDDDSVRTGVAGMLAAGGRIDALVASAGWGLAGAVEQCTIAEAKAQVETNFWGCVRVLQQVLPAMRAQGGGRIVLMSSIGGVIGIPFQAFYSASKFALEGLGEALAYEVAPLGVHMTLVEPSDCYRSAPSRPRPRAAWEPDDHTSFRRDSTFPGCLASYGYDGPRIPGWHGAAARSFPSCGAGRCR